MCGRLIDRPVGFARLLWFSIIQSMKRPAVFFDRDNTLIVNSGYLGDPEKVELLPGAADAVARLRSLGYATAVVSNQSGVGRGMFSEDDVRAVNEKMNRMLLADNVEAVIERHEFCPYHPEATIETYRHDSPRRKPAPGMILDAADVLGLDLGRSWLIGDAPRDVEAGQRAGCRTILLRDSSLESIDEAAKERLKTKPDYIASSLADAAEFIESHSPPPASKPAAVAAIASAAVVPADRSSDQIQLLERIVEELRRGNDPPQEFSIPKMLGGVAQGFAVAALFAALLFRDNPVTFQSLMLVAIFLQALVAGLLLMGR